MTIKQKPVWRMNTGRGVPSDLGDLLIASSDMFDEKPSLHHVRRHMRIHSDVWSDIHIVEFVAYETTLPPRKAKYERVDCLALGCVNGFYGYRKDHKCPRCNGKGYTLEAIK